LGFQRNEPVERSVSQTLALFESLLQHEAVSIARRWWALTLFAVAFI